MAQPLRVLIVEDHAGDAELMAGELRSAGFDPEWHRVDTEAEYLAHLHPNLDVVLSDYHLPKFSGLRALDLLKARQLDIAFIIVSGAIGEETAVSAIKHGASDYLLKDRLARLGTAVTQALDQSRLRKERVQAEEQLRLSHEHLRALAAHLQSAREDEGQRIARELHDELGQALTILKMDTWWIKTQLPKAQAPDVASAVTEKLENMGRFILATNEVIRRICAELRPPALENQGLTAAIETHINEFQSRTGAECTFTLPVDLPHIDSPRAIAIFRILQEILTNITRHANATAVTIELETDSNALHLNVVDNGCGITEPNSVKTNRLGLVGIRERALMFGGEVVIQGKPGEGTSVLVRIPLPPGEAKG